jgi:hypothetical protein
VINISYGLEIWGVTALPLKQNLVLRFEWRKVLKGQQTIARSLTTVAQTSDGENRENLHSPMLLLLLYGCSIGSCTTWSSSVLWHDSFDPRSWSGARDMSNLTRVVSLPVIPHPRVPSSTFLAVIRGRCCGVLPFTVVTPACMPRFHISQEWGIVQCNKVVASLSLQTSLHPSLPKPLGIRDFQPQIVMVDVSYLHSSLGITWRLLGCLEYGVPLLWLHRQWQDQIWLSLLAQSNWVVYGIGVCIALQTVPSSNSIGRCCIKIQPIVDACPNYLNSPSRMLLAYLPRFGWLIQFGHLSAGDRPNCESTEFRGTRAVAPKSERQTMTLDQKWSSSKLRVDFSTPHLVLTGMRWADLVSHSMTTQIESNLWTEASFSLGSALTSMTRQNRWRISVLSHMRNHQIKDRW